VGEQRLDRLLAALHRTDGARSVLERICAVSVDAVGADGAGVSRFTAGGHVMAAASDPGAAQVEGLQVELSEGPCVTACETGHPFLEPDLRSSAALARWPRFAPAALDHGVAAVFAFPMAGPKRPIGALDLYVRRRGDLDADRYEDAVMLADLASLASASAVGDARIPNSDAVSEAAEPWAHPAVVHQASGMVSVQLGIDTDASLLRLRAYAFVNGRRLVDVAAAVVERRLRLDAWDLDE
jgi:GAF domain-containing protein